MKVIYNFWIYCLISTLFSISCNASGILSDSVANFNKPDTIVLMGAEQPELYLPILEGLRVAVVANQTSIVNGMHLVDYLLSVNINIIKVFAPEHGFRGEAGPGDKVDSGVDSETGLKVISLYGSNKRPSETDLKDVDVVIFDIQDVGVRFYTYISTLHYLMEACAENNKFVVVFDRPNPNGFCIDGPVLEKAFSSFVGVSTIPVAHGLTVGEYALLINGEKWLRNTNQCKLKVIAMKNYNHSLIYNLPVRPSPNLPDMISIYLYPSLCFFEGTKISVGRGTDQPFHIIGFPGYDKGEFEFTPKDIEGVIKNPPYEGQLCKGINLSNNVDGIFKNKTLDINWLIEMYNDYPKQEVFFNDFFDKLAGTDKLRIQIVSGKTEYQIRQTWQDDLEKYKILRSKYLLYAD